MMGSHRWLCVAQAQTFRREIDRAIGRAGPKHRNDPDCFRACRRLKQHLFQIDLSVRTGADDRCAIRRGSDRHKFRRPETNPHEQRLEPRSECGDRRD